MFFLYKNTNFLCTAIKSQKGLEIYPEMLIVILPLFVHSLNGKGICVYELTSDELRERGLGLGKSHIAAINGFLLPCYL